MPLVYAMDHEENWSRHIHTYDCHKAHRNEFKGTREVCTLCNKNICAGTYWKHAISKGHTTKERAAGMYTE
jgi:hypothetical protein